MLTVVTGAGGFVGRALVRRMVETGYDGEVRLIDRRPAAAAHGGFETIALDLTDTAAIAAAVERADRVIHLAGLPSAAAERDPAESRRINLEATLNLGEALAASGRRPRLVHASSIAALGAPLPDRVDDATLPAPNLSYGAHKLMAEIGLADLARRGGLSLLSLRLPGIVARPRGAAGFGSAFLSDIFTAIEAGESLALPVSAGSTSWLMSAERCADNLLHAAACPLPDGDRRALTLPALRVRMADLVAAIGRACGRETDNIAYAPDPAIEATFGRYPPLATPAAEALGFRTDDGLDQLVEAALASSREEDPR